MFCRLVKFTTELASEMEFLIYFFELRVITISQLCTRLSTVLKGNEIRWIP